MAAGILQRRVGDIATVLISNPDKLNALTVAMWRELACVMDALSKDEDLRCVVLRGAGEAAFAAGADIAEFATARNDREQGRHYHRELVYGALRAVAACRHPTVAMIHGPCVGGGLELACQCDLRIAGRSSRYGVPINRLGFAIAYDELEAVLPVIGRAAALEILVEGSRRTGLPVDTEVMEEAHIQLALDAGVACLQVGARNALNYSLLRAIGRAVAQKPTAVLLKRSIHMGPVNEFISAAEYIAAFGNPNIILCPRGTTPTLDGYRNHPDESITPLLKEKTWAPVVVDPSHSVGKASYVPAAALAAVAYGADGLCLEAHVSPNHGIGDDPKQALTPETLRHTIKQARQLWDLRRG